jgi:hypothetical protein
MCTHKEPVAHHAVHHHMVLTRTHNAHTSTSYFIHVSLMRRSAVKRFTSRVGRRRSRRRTTTALNHPSRHRHTAPLARTHTHTTQHAPAHLSQTHHSHHLSAALVSRSLDHWRLQQEPQRRTSAASMDPSAPLHRWPPRTHTPTHKHPHTHLTPPHLRRPWRGARASIACPPA